jgi:hypothetical protein
LVTFDPFSSFNTENFLNNRVVQKVVRLLEVITKRWGITGQSDIVDIEFGFEWVSKDSLSHKLTELESGKFSFETSSTTRLSLVDEGLTCFITNI